MYKFRKFIPAIRVIHGKPFFVAKHLMCVNSCHSWQTLKKSKNPINILNVRFLSYLRFMKARKSKNEKEIIPTKSELEVLQVLWASGPSTVRFVHDTLNQQKEAVQYTSTLKLMQVMAEKGMLERDESNMKHIYSAALEQEKTKGFILERFIDSMYSGSVSNMMLALLGNDKTSKKDLQAVKEMLKKLDDKK